MKIKIYVLVSLVLAMTSCTNWLDVTPEDEIVEKDLYADATGAHNVLNGLYKGMAKPALYGKELTYGFLDVAGQVYNVEMGSFEGDGISSNSIYYRVARFEYNYNADIEKIISSIWESQYKVIINANNLIYNTDQIPATKFKFGQEEKNMVLGEAMAVRAICHFDLLRLYAPAPVRKSSDRYIHYALQSDVNKPGFNTEPLTIEETLKLIEKDLLAAKDLISSYDTLSQDNRNLLAGAYRFQMSQVSESVGIFYEFRGYRINVLAVNALLARIYNYWGKHDESAKYANYVINFELSEGDKLLSFAGGSLIAADRKFVSDLIFGVSYPKLMEDYTEYTKPSGNHPLTLRYYKSLFAEYEFKDEGDYRSKHLLKKGESESSHDFYPLKNVEYEPENYQNDITPMIRLSEMYFILADAYAASGDFVGAQKAINTIRVGRNCTEADLGIIDMETYKTRSLEEFQREFFQEGQIFFQFKKYDVKLTTNMSIESFTLKIPNSQNV